MQYFIMLLVVLCCFCSFMIGVTLSDSDFESVINNSIKNMKSLKRDCEKDLPRYQECTLIYEFVPTKTKGDK